MKKDNKFLKFKKIMFISSLTLILLISLFSIGSYLYIKNKLSNVKTVSISKDPVLLGIAPNMVSKKQNTANNTASSSTNDATVVVSPKATEDTSKITNILIIGKDSRVINNQPGQADAIMILTVDEKHDKLKLTSVMRDSYVTMDGHSSQKLTNSHAFGGALFTLKTVNENYNMNITDYVEVNFYSLAKIIDYVGGISIDVKPDEIYWENFYINETAELEGVSPPLVTSPGLQTLNGRQAVGYARIRYVGNNDFERTSRQRAVFTILFDKLVHKNITDIPTVMDTLLKDVETSLNPDDIMSLAKYILIHRITTIQQSRIPYDNLYHDAVINGADVLVWDKQPTIDKLHEFIFQSKGN